MVNSFCCIIFIYFKASAANAKKKMEDMLDDPTAFSLKYDELKNKKYFFH